MEFRRRPVEIVKTRMLETIAAAVEVTAGSALIINPNLVVHLLIGASLSSGGVAVGRVGGFGLLSLGLACWPSGAVVTARATGALFTYNLLSSLFTSLISVLSEVSSVICCGPLVLFMPF